ncbi:biotin--[acetyl-CoA-carboxylase] ligase [Tardiphaga sp.]|uniref:biotin--[acetyl-CoA-carboxylase] ligase n=1 Tax=Tardiphaga sp. TaxID=1926292 RepID=UPI0026010AE4|nr:biotin--[acetyl-CoA-carboxylase] ligase [Tardiphaga sp.]
MGFSLGPRAAAAGYRLAAFDSAGSTNVEAMNRAREGERGPMWFVTSEQTAGRGRRHRPWVAPRGNLASSILEVMDVSPALAATLGFAAGLALEAALARVSMEALLRSPGSEEMKFALKWPNDVLAGRAKLAGILLEAEAVGDGGLAVVVGIGTNVVAFPEGTPYPATALRALGIDTSAEDLFNALSDSWTEYRGIWDNGRGFDEIRSSWLARAAGLGEPVSIQSGSSIISGIFDTIDESGCLIVSTSDGKRIPISAGDVHFGSTASAGATQ